MDEQMHQIILVSGFGGSGKSTCAQMLWDRLENVAIVEADHLFRIKPFEMNTVEGRELIGRVKLGNSLAVTTNFMQEKFENIIVEGFVWSQSELDAVSELAGKHEFEIWCFWLKTSTAVRHKRAIARGRDEADSQEFLNLVEQKIKDPTPLLLPKGHYHEIVTDELSSEKVVEEMIRFMSKYAEKT